MSLTRAAVVLRSIALRAGLCFVYVEKQCTPSHLIATMSSESPKSETAMPEVLSEIDKLKEVSTSQKMDNEILQALVKNPVVQSLAKAHTAMEEQKIKPSLSDSFGLLNQIVEHLEDLKGNQSLAELRTILTTPHIAGLLKCHDAVAVKHRANMEQLHGTSTNGNGLDCDDSDENVKLPRAIRMVGLYKTSWEPMGLTVVKEDGHLKVARILHGSEIERKGLLHVDDIIMEVNGNKLGADPKKLQEYLLKTNGTIIFKISPSYEENLPPKLLYIKCHIDYNPKSDSSIPCVEAGLSFSQGDILQVVDQTDENWWQAQRVNNKGEARGRAGLIPSQSFEEKRRAVSEMKKKNSPEKKKKSRKKKSFKTMYKASENSAFDKHDIVVYEEVACIPPFSRKTLVLLTRSRTTADEICHSIVNANPDIYGIAEGEDIEASFLGSRSSNSDDLHSEQSLYCPQLNEVREIIKGGKTCVLNATPQCLKLLRTSEFMPYVAFVKSTENENSDDKVFLTANADVEKYYMKYIDTVLEASNDTPEQVAANISERMEQLKLKHQWVPTSWVY